MKTDYLNEVYHLLCVNIFTYYHKKRCFQLLLCSNVSVFIYISTVTIFD